MNNDQNDWNAPPQQDSSWETPQQNPMGDQLPQHQPPNQSPGTPVKLESGDYLPVILALIPGLGQLMLGQTAKGLVILGIALFTCAGGGLISVASVIDAYLVAVAKKRRVVGEWEFFPDYQETLNL